MEAAGVASARPAQCADIECPPPPQPSQSTHAGTPSYFPVAGPSAPAATQTFICGDPAEGCFQLTGPGMLYNPK